MLKRKYNYKTKTYQTVADFYIDIIENKEYYDAFLYEKTHGVKESMFGCSKKDATYEEYLGMIECQLANDIMYYVEEHMHDYVYDGMNMKNKLRILKAIKGLPNYEETFEFFKDKYKQEAELLTDADFPEDTGDTKAYVEVYKSMLFGNDEEWKGDTIMLILSGIIILLFIISTSIKYGNPHHEVQKVHNKEWTDKVVNDINNLMK